MGVHEEASCLCLVMADCFVMASLWIHLSVVLSENVHSELFSVSRVETGELIKAGLGPPGAAAHHWPRQGPTGHTPRRKVLRCVQSGSSRNKCVERVVSVTE